MTTWIAGNYAGAGSVAGLDMTGQVDPGGVASGNVVSAMRSSTQLIVTLDNGVVGHFEGHDFTYDGAGDITGGTITELWVEYSGFVLDHLSDFAITWQLLATYVLSNDSVGLIAYLFSGDDEIVGTTLNDHLTGVEGDDLFRGTKGNDIYDGGNGTDAVDFSAAKSGVHIDLSLGGTQLVGGGNGSDTFILIENLTGSKFDDDMSGNAGVNLLIGGNGNDKLDGGTGEDVLRGGKGNDIYDVDDSNDTVSEAGGSGNDTVLAETTFVLPNGVENLTLLGNGDFNGSGRTGADHITGNSGRNTLKGNAGADALVGEGGNDVLNGGFGADDMTGGSGSDRFVFSSAADSGITGPMRDVIPDFTQGEDLIDLRPIDPNPGGPDHHAFTFLGTAQFTGTIGEIRYQKLADKTVIRADVDGDTVADFMIELTGALDLASADFLL